MNNLHRFITVGASEVDNNLCIIVNFMIIRLPSVRWKALSFAEVVYLFFLLDL